MEKTLGINIILKFHAITTIQSEEEKEAIMSAIYNLCAVTTVGVSGGLPNSVIIDCLKEHGTDELKRALAEGEMLGDEVFTIMGTQMLCVFKVYIYLSDTRRVFINSYGVQGLDEVPTHDVRFEPFGLTYDEVGELTFNPLHVGGHFEPVREVFAGTEVASPW